ncbi:MAG: nucleoside triphosphate pyrophosphohydrolase [Bacteroidota bacterium]|nr:nucleoside triphosphate pyrophosphohydrolase [Bacteroidota bacterium]
MNSKADKLKAFERILTIMDELRAGCPWDAKQTNESLRPLTIEETYELAEAIMENNSQEIKKELGDLFLHIIFYAKIGSEKNEFDMADVINSLAEKLIRRHPHVYGDTKIQNTDEIKNNWEQIKLKEKDGNKSILGGIPNSLPALVKAVRVQEKARGAGFDWDVKEQVWDKVKEEIAEFEEAVSNQDQTEKEAEFGDIMFSLINAARLYDINPENALERTNKKFISRFNFLETKAKAMNKSLPDMSLNEMEEIWNEAKTTES